MRDRSGTIRNVSPRPRNEPSAAVLDRLRELAARIDTDTAERKRLGLAALDAGGSVRVVAAAAGVSPTTVQKWKETDGE